MLCVSVGVAIAGGVAGLYLSYYAGTAGGASIALCLVGAYLAGPRRRRGAAQSVGTPWLAAVRAGAAQHDVVLVDRELEALRERRDGLLEAVVGELRHAAAAVADDVVVVLAAGVRGLVARRAVADVEPVHEAEAIEHLERAVDARDADARVLGAQLVGDLLRRGAAVLPRERVDDARARGAGAEALALERRVRVGAPGRVMGRAQRQYGS